MKKKESKKAKTIKEETIRTGCGSGSEGFKKMSEMMSKCFSGGSKYDCSTIMENMKDPCCESDHNKNKKGRYS